MSTTIINNSGVVVNGGGNTINQQQTNSVSYDWEELLKQANVLREKASCAKKAAGLSADVPDVDEAIHSIKTRDVGRFREAMKNISGFVLALIRELSLNVLANYITK